MYNIERNEPCWCGSCKKYKVCHLDSDNDNLALFQSRGYPLPTRDLILSPNQIEGMKKSSILSKYILDEAQKHIKEGITTLEINNIIHKLTIDNGAIPAPLNYNGFPKSCCTSINNVVCHGIPSKNDILKNGDILNVDITSILNGYYSDMSRMYTIGNVLPSAKKLIEVTKECLDIGIRCIKPYMPIGDIGNAIEAHANKYGYGVVKALCGHGIGLKFHQEPNVNHYKTNKKTMIIVPNMVFTIEPMINEGNFDCYTLSDDWTVVTKDNSLSAQWEHTILVTEDGSYVLTN